MKKVRIDVGEWFFETKYMTPAERGIYFDLILIYLSSESPIKRGRLELIADRYTETERECLNRVISAFFEEQEDGFHNECLDKQITETQKKRNRSKQK